MRKVGDVSRRRRLADRARQRWYARHRAVRFARRFGFASQLPVKACTCFAASCTKEAAQK